MHDAGNSDIWSAPAKARNRGRGCGMSEEIGARLISSRPTTRPSGCRTTRSTSASTGAWRHRASRRSRRSHGRAARPCTSRACTCTPASTRSTRRPAWCGCSARSQARIRARRSRATPSSATAKTTRRASTRSACTVGVANLRGRPTLAPRYLTQAPRGQGVAELARVLGALRASAE